MALEEEEESALILIPVAALGRVCVSWERVVDVDLQQESPRQRQFITSWRVRALTFLPLNANAWHESFAICAPLRSK